MIAEIDRAKKDGYSVGGVVEVVARGVPAGLGAFAQWDRRLDGRIAQALMSIHAVKAVAIGAGFEAGETRGASFHDEILWDERGIARPTNAAPAASGAASRTAEIRAVVKPIPTLYRAALDWTSAAEPQKASVERSAPASCQPPVCGGAMLALVLGDALLGREAATRSPAPLTSRPRARSDAGSPFADARSTQEIIGARCPSGRS
jgi:chorismate synthase